MCLTLLNVTIGFLTGRSSLQYVTSCAGWFEVHWTHTHTHPQTKSTYWVHLPFSEVLSSSTTYCFRTRKKHGGWDCFGYRGRAVGYGGLFWHPLESQALLGLSPLSTYDHNKGTASPLTTHVSFTFCMRLFHSVLILICFLVCSHSSKMLFFKGTFYPKIKMCWNLLTLRSSKM